MIGYKIHKQDIQKLENKLNKIDLKVIGDLEKEFGITASMIQVRAKKDAPVDTGFLKSSINFGKNTEGVFVQASADYAPYQEFGTSRVKAQPFFFNNAKIEIRQLLKRLENKIKRLL
jgi:HK97 gp10 family phage protein